MVDSVEILVVGAGVIGLATARRLACEGHEVLVVESGDKSVRGPPHETQRSFMLASTIRREA